MATSKKYRAEAQKIFRDKFSSEKEILNKLTDNPALYFLPLPYKNIFCFFLKLWCKNWYMNNLMIYKKMEALMVHVCSIVFAGDISGLE